MSLNVSSSGGGDFELVPAGLYVARCYRIIDLGTQTTNWMGKEKQSKKVMLSWELLDDDVRMKDGRPFAVHKNYTASLGEKATLRADLESWRNKKFTDAELESFDLKNVLGAYCQIQVVHDEEGKYANVQSIVTYKPPKDAQGGSIWPEPVNPDLAFDIDEPDMEIFNSLSDNMKQKIVGAPEWGKQPMPDGFLKQDEVTNPTDAELDNPQIPDLDEVKKGKK